MTKSINDLPRDVFGQILKYLPYIKDLNSVKVNKKFRDFSRTLKYNTNNLVDQKKKRF